MNSLYLGNSEISYRGNFSTRFSAERRMKAVKPVPNLVSTFSQI